MDSIYEIECGFRKKYETDMAEIIQDLNALQSVVDTLMKVSVNRELGEEMTSCLTIIQQSVGRILLSVHQKAER